MKHIFCLTYCSILLVRDFKNLINFYCLFGMTQSSNLSSCFDGLICFLFFMLFILLHLFFDLFLTPFSLWWNNLLLLNSYFIFLFKNFAIFCMIIEQVLSAGLIDYYFIIDSVTCLNLCFNLNFWSIFFQFNYFLEIYFLAQFHLYLLVKV